ncbi:MAG: ABC transporter ATP-binding protein [Microbacterium sp.]
MKIRDSWWSIRLAFRVAPWLMSLTVLITVLLGVVPSLQVLLIERMSQGVLDGDVAAATTAAVLSGVTVGGYLGIQQVMYALQRMIQVEIQPELQRMLSATLSRLQPSDIGDLTVQSRSRASRDDVVEGRLQMQPVSVMSAAFAVVVAAGLTITIGRISVVAALLMLACLAPMTLASSWYASRESIQWPKISEAARVGAYRDDQLIYQTTAMELATLDARSRVAASAYRARSDSRRALMRLERSGLASDAMAAVVCCALLVGAFIALIRSDASAALIAGSAVGMLSGITATSSVGFVIGSLLTGANAIRRFRAFTEMRPDGGAPPERIPVSELVVDDLSVSYSSSEEPVLHGASIRASRGEVVAVVGPNGAGKTTLIRGIMGLADVTSGTIRFDGVDVTSQSFDERHGAIGLLSQEFGRYELTVRENLLLGAGAAEVDDDRLWEALRTARADGFVGALPDGLDTQLGEQWGGPGLSGGQWQRLALARLALRNAGIWILDEPTSAIDAEAEAQILGELRGSASDRITLFVSHRAWTLKGVDRSYVVDEGRIVESGTYDQLQAAGGRFAELFASQQD